MSEIWLDYSWARPSLTAAKAAGAHGVLRYLCPINSDSAGKVLDLAERDAIEAAGLDWALTFEWYSTRALEGRGSGLADGLTALHQAQQLGYRKGASIYPAHDTGLRDDPQVAAYLHAFAESIGGFYEVDVYSGIGTVDAMIVAGWAQRGWQTLAWSDGQVSSRAVLYQNGRTWFGGGADENVLLRGSVNGQHALGTPPKPGKPGKPVTSPKPISGGGVYVVRSGDTLSAIAARHASTVAAIATLNGLANPNRIYVGEQLRMPAGKPPRKPVKPIVLHRPHTVTVRQGDTLSGIAARVGCTWQRLQQINRLRNVNLIYPGEVLRVP